MRSTRPSASPCWSSRGYVHHVHVHHVHVHHAHVHVHVHHVHVHVHVHVHAHVHVRVAEQLYAIYLVACTLLIDLIPLDST